MKKTILPFVLLLSVILTFSFKIKNAESNKSIRVSYTINDAWKFFKGESPKAYKPSFNDENWLDVNIPHDFNGGSDGVNNDVFNGRFDFKNDHDKRMMYKGSGWYRKNFSIDKKFKDKKIFIEFEAVSLEANVWVNGKKVGTHKGGYTAFEFDITPLVKFGKTNVLTVKADNTNNPLIAPWMDDEQKSFPHSFDYAIYGGIYRDVHLHITDPVRIERVLNTADCGGQAPAVVTIETKVMNYSKNDKKVSLKTMIYSPDGQIVATKNSTKNIPANTEISFKQSQSEFDNLKMWDVDNPNLYKVKSEISSEGKVIDDYESIFGFRYFSLANNSGFKLNGKKVLIRGINRHQDMEGLGYALPNEQHHKDVKLIKEGGFNFIRHAHYPCDREFAKACDEQGVMLWLEIPYTGSTSADPKFLENCKSQMKEMITQYYNNPSVIVWGVGNESDRSGAKESVSNRYNKELHELAKELDPGRMTTGCNFKYESNHKTVDVYAPQDWTGWYHAEMDKYMPEEIIGEYGCSVHLPFHSAEKLEPSIDYKAASNHKYWTQEFGAFIHEYKCSVGESRSDSFPGHFVWVAFDFASPRLGRGSNPIPFMNQKGLFLHDHKTPKDVYYFYQSMYRSASDYPMVYIVSETWKDRWEKPGAKDIWLYSNCDSVELFNDYGNISYGKRTKDAGPRGDTRFQWNNINVNYNVLYAEGWYNNKIVARDTLILDNLPKK